SPASPISAANSRARSARALSCIRAGISSESSSSRKSAMGINSHSHRLVSDTRTSLASCRPPVLLHPGAAGALRELADAADIGLALGDRDHAAGLQGVEDVARLDRLVVGGQRQLRLDAAPA